jgi:phosphoserine phosphatase RsbU/P
MPASAVLVVRNPSGGQNRIRVEHLPFRIGRHGDNDLVLRDSRASRYHAVIVAQDADYVIEDLKSSYGVFVNGERVPSRKLHHGDRVEFGFPDSYQVTFRLEEAHAAADSHPSAGSGSSSLAKLRATLEVARALQDSLSTDEVLSTVVEAALTVTGCERGFLLLRQGDDLEIRIARSRTGPLRKTDLGVPTRLLNRALNQRREFLSMDFDPDETMGAVEHSVYDLELRSVVCLPLVRIRSGSVAETASLSPAQDTIGLLYMDSRVRSADLSAGGRELLTTLALEASTVLENARLLEEQWARQRIEQELRIARQIQKNLMPRELPDGGWFRAVASSIPSLEVGGDYADVRQVNQDCWVAVIADVSGKGVGAALLASLLQGMFLAAPFTRLSIEDLILRANRFLNERTGGEQYATAFYATLDSGGCLRWVNAGHLPPFLLRAGPSLESLPANGTPLGLLEEAVYTVAETRLAPGDQLILYTDGLTEAQNPLHEYFGHKRLRDTILAHAGQDCRAIHAALRAELDRFSAGSPPRDDVTLALLQYAP